MENYLKIYQNKQEYDQEGNKPILGHIIDDIELLNSSLRLNAENFPDANFRAALAEILEINEGEEITAAKIAATTSLNVFNKSIADLKGVEHFAALRELWCKNNQLTTLDVSQNTEMTELYCDNNQLTSLDVSGCTALKKLECNYNQLTSLNVSGCTALEYLYCYNNQLTSLDVSKNTNLTSLYCSRNPLTSLDVSKNTAITNLYCGNNNLTSLDVSQNTALKVLDCRNNQLASLDISNAPEIIYIYENYDDRDGSCFCYDGECNFCCDDGVQIIA